MLHGHVKLRRRLARTAGHPRSVKRAMFRRGSTSNGIKLYHCSPAVE